MVLAFLLDGPILEDVLMVCFPPDFITTPSSYRAKHAALVHRFVSAGTTIGAGASKSYQVLERPF